RGCTLFHAAPASRSQPPGAAAAPLRATGGRVAAAGIRVLPRAAHSRGADDGNHAGLRQLLGRRVQRQELLDQFEHLQGSPAQIAIARDAVIKAIVTYVEDVVATRVDVDHEQILAGIAPSRRALSRAAAEICEVPLRLVLAAILRIVAIAPRQGPIAKAGFDLGRAGGIAEFREQPPASDLAEVIENAFGRAGEELERHDAA